jgi:prefoldin subunit 5
MTKEELDTIENLLQSLPDASNKELVENMDVLSKEFEILKDLIIKMTHNIDLVEKYYNTILKEYDKRHKD